MPKAPQLFLRGGTDNTQQYKVNDLLVASCRVADARPVANISWFLGKLYSRCRNNQITVVFR